MLSASYYCEAENSPLQLPSDWGEFQAYHSFSLQCGFQKIKKCAFFTFFCGTPGYSRKGLISRIYLSVHLDFFLESDWFFLNFDMALDRAIWSCAWKVLIFWRKKLSIKWGEWTKNATKLAFLDLLKNLVINCSWI